MKDNNRLVRTLMRIALGFVFLWAFLDKVFGLGYSTKSASSWLSGGSPTAGFLKSATYGPFAHFFKGLAGNPLVDWLFMLGLLGVGLALILGVALRLAAVAGIIMLLMMWLAAFPPKTNPLIDEHIIYIIVLVGLAKNGSNTYLSLSKWWSKTIIVKKLPFLA